MKTSWLREPLLHFLLIGALLFLVYGLMNEQDTDTAPDTISISDTQIKLLTLRWEKKWQRPPTATELNGLIEQEIREQVRYREALTMGLDKNDPVVRRRMAQKIDFISSDLAAQIEPDDAQLETFFLANQQQFEQPGRISFVQVYLNADRRGPQLDADAQALLTNLQQQTSDKSIESLGDPFMFGHAYQDQDGFSVSRVFGQEFSQAVFALPTGNWQGPIRSGVGYHIVRVDDKSPTTLPTLESVRDKVRDAWMDAERRKMNEALYQQMRSKYQVVLPEAYQAL